MADHIYSSPPVLLLGVEQNKATPSRPELRSRIESPWVTRPDNIQFSGPLTPKEEHPGSIFPEGKTP